MLRRSHPPDPALVQAARSRLAAVVESRAGGRSVGGWVPEQRAVDHADDPGVDEARADGADADGAGVGGSALSDRLPPWARGLRLGRAQAAVVVVALVLALGGGGWVYLSQRPGAVTVEATSVAAGTPLAGESAQPSPGASAGAAAAPDGQVVVHVAGLVAQPGVVTLAAGSRVVDAIAASGGAQKGVDLTALNLARVLDDGEQILVGIAPPPGEAAGDAGSPADAGPDGSGAVDLNAATLEQLETLPGIGPALAQRILDWRERNGSFSSVDELREVAGIGEKRFAELAPLVRI